MIHPSTAIPSAPPLLQVTVSGRDRTIQDLQKRVDTLRSELEGERTAANMERQETARCRQEHVQLANKVAQLETDVMAERQRVAGGHTTAGAQQYVGQP